MKKVLLALVIVALTAISYSAHPQAKHSFAITNGNFLYDGQPIKIYSGEMHYERIPAPYWRHRLKMIKAMGLNAVATYVFWNYHETTPGVWDWTTGSHNIRQFIKTAAEEGLMVILRPGPYSCGEWEFGGYPWWLQKEKKLVIRTMNEPFLDSCKVYINQLASQVRDLQITKGGPIIMVQAENEFGSYVAQRPDIPLETHKQYSAAIRQELLDAGFDIPMFTSDGDWLLKEGTIEGAHPTANGETNIENLKKTLNEYTNNQGPYMVAEYYPGWLDHWGEPFQKGPTSRVYKQVETYLENGINFNFYMVHGGTNFAFTAGANYSDKKAIQPDITSYDYDAPISEAGWATVKYDSLRMLFKQHVSYNVPEVPKAIPVITPTIKLSKQVKLFDLVAKMKPVLDINPLTFEDLNQGYGYVLYRRQFGTETKGLLKIKGLRDFATVYINRQKVGELNRITGLDSLNVDIPNNGTLDILVENMGRINYGKLITENLKGIISPIYIDEDEVSGGWEMYKLPMNQMPNLIKYNSTYTQGSPILYEGTFNLSSVGDVFLNMEDWGKGIVFVNGINLGRYWKIGPQQTLYLPGCFLKKGINRMVVFEQLNDKKQTSISGVKTPLLDKLKE